MNSNSHRFLLALSDIDERFIEETAAYPPTQTARRPKRLLRILLVAALVLTQLVLGLAAANEIGIPGLERWFLDRATGSEATGSPLASLSANGYHLMEDNDVLKIEAVDALRSGASIRIAFLVTLKTVDSALVDGGMSPLPGWRFEDSFIRNGPERLPTSSGHRYCDQYSSLEKNQFLLILGLDQVPTNADSLAIELNNIVRYDQKQGRQLLYEGTWTYVLDSSSFGQSGKTLYPDTHCVIDGFDFTVQRIDLSAFACVIVCQLDEKQLANWCALLTEESAAFHAAARDMEILNADGKAIPYVLTTGTFSTDETRWRGAYTITAEFDVPLVNQHASQIKLFDHWFALDE